MGSFLDYAELEIREWVIRARNYHRPHAWRLEEGLRTRLVPFFSAGILDRIRILNVESIEHPPFPYDLIGMRFGPAFGFAAGITYIDTILISDRLTGRLDRNALIFHEAVHVVQYRYLGIDRFMRHYVNDLIKYPYEHHRISIEAQAYRLQRKFENNHPPFSVEDATIRFFQN